MRRVADNPPARFPDRAIAEATHPWFVAHVKPRTEKAVADDCVRKNIEYYLPMAVKITRRKDNNKPRKSILPLFPGYISIAGTRETYYDLYKNGQIASIIEIKHQKKFIEELGQVYSILEKGVMLEPCLDAFMQGTEVQVAAGPLKGVRGIVQSQRNESRLVISVEGLGRAMMTVDASMVKPVQ